VEKRVILTIGIALALMWAWVWISGKIWPAPPPAPVAASRRDGGAAVGAPQAASGPSSAATSQAASVRPPEEIVEIPQRGTASKFRASLTSYGGALQHFVLTDPQYQEERGGRWVPIDLVRGGRSALGGLPLQVSVRGKVIKVPEDVAYTVSHHDDREVVFAYRGPTVRVEKRYQFDPQTYVFSLAVTVTNVGAARDEEVRATVQLFGWQNPADRGGGWFKPPRNTVSAACYANGSLEREGEESLRKKPLQRNGDVRWIGVDETYFVLAAAPAPEKDRERACRAEGRSGDAMESDLLYAPRTLEPGGSETYNLVVFAGPKVVRLLDGVSVSGENVHLGEAVDFGWFAVIARPLLWILKFFHAGVRNWGLAIILLTLFVRLITLYWTQKQMRSMKDMAKLKPKMAVLQQKHKDDKNRLNQEVMAMYKAHGVSPLAGCLPMLLQMPIWFALYRSLQVSVELYRAPFALWITDLTAPDRYFVMPLMTGALTFLQQKISPSTPDNQQQKMMMYMMPVMFTAFTLFVPAGLTLYILTSTILSMVHQLWMNRRDGQESTLGVAAEPRPTAPASKMKKG
jgi:YidC/Oxa1 family membrane protein insertase